MPEAGWLLLLLFLGVCSLIVVGMLWPSFLRASATTALSYQRPEQPSEALRVPVMPVTVDWIQQLISSLHLLFIGHSRGGKTTLIHEVATRLASLGNRVVVCDPDAAPGLWPGCEVYGYKNDLASINGALSTVKEDVEQRRGLRGEGAQRSFPPLYLVIDEYQDVGRSADCPIARPLVEDILRRGGKLDVHLVIGVQDKQVKTMGFEGQGDLRRNFSFIVEVRRDRDGQRWATVAEGSDERQVEIYPIPSLKDLDALVERVITPTQEQQPEQPIEGNEDVSLSPEQIAIIVVLISQGNKTKTEVVKAIPGYNTKNHRVYSAYYDRLRTAVGTSRSEAA